MTTSPLRTVFMGTPAFAVPTLRALSAHHTVLAVFTKPDAVSGRGGRRVPSAVKTAALELGLPVREPTSLRSLEVLAELRDLSPDVIVVAAYGLILPKEVLDVPRFGCVNVHASLLPRWRGAAPVQRAILAGDQITGVSIMRMEEGLDTGPYCRTASLALEGFSATSLTEELAKIGARELLLALETLQHGACEWVEQDETAATYAPKVQKEDVLLSPELTVTEAIARVRASSRQAPARLSIEERNLSVLAAEPFHVVLPPGAVQVTKRDLAVGVSDGSLRLTIVRPEGRAEMDGAAWARGARVSEHSAWTGAR